LDAILVFLLLTFFPVCDTVLVQGWTSSNGFHEVVFWRTFFCKPILVTLGSIFVLLLCGLAGLELGFDPLRDFFIVADPNRFFFEVDFVVRSTIFAEFFEFLEWDRWREGFVVDDWVYLGERAFLGTLDNGRVISGLEGDLSGNFRDFVGVVFRTFEPRLRRRVRIGDNNLLPDLDDAVFFLACASDDLR
jgi:hypothetical protein